MPKRPKENDKQKTTQKEIQLVSKKAAAAAHVFFHLSSSNVPAFCIKHIFSAVFNLDTTTTGTTRTTAAAAIIDTSVACACGGGGC